MTKKDIPVQVWYYTEPYIKSSFLEQLGRQISSEIELTFRIQNLNRFIGHYGIFSPLVVNKEGWSYLLLDVTSTTVCGCRFWIRFRSLLNPEEYIPLDDSRVFTEENTLFEIAPKDPNDPPLIASSSRRVWEVMQELWMDTLKSWMSPEEHVKKASAKQRFDFIQRASTWPDVQFDFTFDGPVDYDMAKEIDILLGDFTDQWNEYSEKKRREQFIHFHQKVESEEENTVSFAVDFGSAKPMRVVNALLKKIHESTIPVKTITMW